MSRHYRVDEVLADLAPEERVQYDALLRGPVTTIDDLIQWLGEKGFKVSRGAVHNHRKGFEEVLKGVRVSAELARSFMQVAREGGAEALGEAALTRFQQLLVEKLLQMDSSGELDAGELMKLSVAMNSAASTRQRIESIKDEYEKKQKDAVAKAELAAKSGSSGESVVAAIKQALGITAGDEEKAA